MRGKLPKHEIGSGNVFADVGLPDAELHLLKAEIVNCIDDILKERRLTQAAAAPHGHQPAGRLEDAARPLPRLQPGAAADLSGCVGAGRDHRCAPAGAGEGGIDQNRGVGAAQTLNMSAAAPFSSDCRRWSPT